MSSQFFEYLLKFIALFIFTGTVVSAFFVIYTILSIEIRMIRRKKKENFIKEVQSAVADLYLDLSAHNLRLRKLESNQKNNTVKK